MTRHPADGRKRRKALPCIFKMDLPIRAVQQNCMACYVRENLDAFASLVKVIVSIPFIKVVLHNLFKAIIDLFRYNWATS